MPTDKESLVAVAEAYYDMLGIDACLIVKIPPKDDGVEMASE